MSRVCEDTEAGGGACDSLDVEATIAEAAARLVAKLIFRCGPPIVLENLGFPAGCPDAGGPPFTIDDLIGCIRDGHADAADDLIDVQYPPD